MDSFLRNRGWHCGLNKERAECHGLINGFVLRECGLQVIHKYKSNAAFTSYLRYIALSL